MLHNQIDYEYALESAWYVLYKIYKLLFDILFKATTSQKYQPLRAHKQDHQRYF